LRGWCLSYAHFLNIVGLDDWGERQQLNFMDYSMGGVTSEELALIYIDETSKQETDHDRQRRHRSSRSA